MLSSVGLSSDILRYVSTRGKGVIAPMRGWKQFKFFSPHSIPQSSPESTFYKYLAIVCAISDHEVRYIVVYVFSWWVQVCICV